MEHLTPSSPDEEPRGPDEERLWPGEVDFTGIVRQDDVLSDIIGDAIGEAEADGGELPEWGVRTLARALANEHVDPLSGALHQFAVTGQADPQAVIFELGELYLATEDDQVREWVNWLGTYVVRTRDTAATAPTEVPVWGTSLDQVSAYFEIKFAEADVRGGTISQEDAQAIATVLATSLPDSSAMSNFAHNGDADLSLLQAECEHLASQSWRISAVQRWISRLQQHLALRDDPGNPPPE